MNRDNIVINIPEKAKFIIDTLQKAGFEAYVVGGCVRDSILGRNPQDWDITTSATPMEVKGLFRRTIDTGLQHGTVTIMDGEEGFEVTTYRIDGKYEDGRHPQEVTFTPNLEEDLLRRDFTINAMAYNDTAGLVDLYGGLEDIEKKQIRCVGDAFCRFGEDALRMLRAVRFSAQLSYEIEQETYNAIKELAPTLSKISAERVQTELVKMLVSDHPDYLRTMWELGLTKVFFPEFDKAMDTAQNHKHHCYSVGEHILHSMTSIPADKELRLAMMLHDIGKPETITIDEEGITHFHGHAQKSEEIAKTVLKRLKFDNHTLDVVRRLVLYHDYGNGVQARPVIVRRAINKIGNDIMMELFAVKRADMMAQSEYMRQEKEDNLNNWIETYENIIQEKQCFSMKDLAISGADLIALGMKPGKEMGTILQSLLDEVLENPECNTKEYLLKKVKDFNL